MSTENDDYVCAFSGLTPPDDSLPEEDDGRDDIPTGWTRVTFARSLPNPEWSILQALKESTLQQLLQQIPEAQRKDAEPLLRVQVAVTYHAYESTLEPYFVEEEEVYLAPGEMDPDIATAHKQLRETLGLEPLEVAEPAPKPVVRKKPKKEGAK